MWLKALFLFEGNSYSFCEVKNVIKMKILDYFMIANGKECD